jgi:ABC-type ATPase involved in cell division
MPLRLPVGQVTALLGPGLVRRRVMAALDDGCLPGLARLTAAKDESADARRATIASAAGAAVVLADRLTDGLDAAERRVVLTGLRDLAATGAAVLVDDVDPVATVAVADGALRADRTGALVLERLEEAYLAS